ncbi:MAG: aspartate aminotransferase family protein [Gammaproteobacteria bacterium]|nr:MAG: aspartate aminotransferase family protein [Gammaproteobacteria bacterium]
MSNVFPRNCKINMPLAVQGDGVYIIDRTGKRYLDASGGAAVSCLGHSDEEVIEAVKNQLERLEFAHTGFFSSVPAEALAELLIQEAPGDLDRVYFVSGGSEAVEAAIKLARQYYVEIGQPSRHRVISRLQSYHGNTLGALAAGGNLWRREQFDPLMIETSHISPCYAYRWQQPDESEFDYGQRVANELEAEIQRVGEDQVMAFIAEPVVGATLGAVPAVEGYFKRIREICNQYGILLILDEVMCGMGRTGSLYACDQEDIAPDILTIAKGLGAGYQPIGAMLCSDKIYQAIEQGSGFFQHGHTYLGHPVACAAAHAVVKKIMDRRVLDGVLAQGVRLHKALLDKFGEHPNIGDIRGRGLFFGLEFVRERDTKAPFPAELAFNKRLKQNAFEAGLICYPMGGTIDGKQGDHVLLAPPFIIDTGHIEEIVSKLDTAIKATLRSL